MSNGLLMKSLAPASRARSLEAGFAVITSTERYPSFSISLSAFRPETRPCPPSSNPAGSDRSCVDGATHRPPWIRGPGNRCVLCGGKHVFQEKNIGFLVVYNQYFSASNFCLSDHVQLRAPFPFACAVEPQRRNLEVHRPTMVNRTALVILVPAESCGGGDGRTVGEPHASGGNPAALNDFTRKISGKHG